MLNYCNDADYKSRICIVKNPYNEDRKIDIGPLFEMLSMRLIGDGSFDDSFKDCAYNIDSFIQLTLIELCPEDLDEAFHHTFKKGIENLFHIRDCFNEIHQIERRTRFQNVTDIINNDQTNNSKQ